MLWVKNLQNFSMALKREMHCGAIKMLLDDRKEITTASEICLTLK